jgi:hypothetical protein
MNKKIPKRDITDPRTLAIESLERLGGIEGFVSWGKTHRTLFYNLYAKLMAQPLVQHNVAVNVINDGEAARRKLEDAFLHLIESRKYENVDPAAFVNGERIIEHQPLAADPRPVMPDPAPQADVDDASSPQKGPVFSRGGVSTTATETSPGGGQNKNTHYSKPIPSIPGVAAGVALDGSDENKSSTQLFYEWKGHGKPP